MTSFHTTLAVLTLIGTLLANVLPAQQPNRDDDTFAEMLKSTSDGISDASINEILEIRKRLGGGTGLETHGLFESTESTENGCRQADSQPTCQEGLNPGSPDYQFAVTPSEQLFFSMLDFDPSDNRRPSEADGQTVQDQNVRQIRDIARQLEQLAADLEEIGLFDDADSLRSRVARLRSTARATATAGRDPNLIRR